MIVRWFTALAFGLGLLATCMGGLLWLASTTDIVANGVRQARVAHQSRSQQLSILTSERHAEKIDNLDQTLDALQITLAESVSRDPLPDGVLAVSFEQRVLPGILISDELSPVNTLRLVLDMSVRHSVGVINVIDRIRETIVAWPIEVRACELKRQPQQQLHAHCVIDLYHWSAEPADTESASSMAHGAKEDGA